MALNIEEQTAKKLYDESPDWFQEQLIKAFGAECFEKKDYENIRSFEDACDKLGILPGDVFHPLDTPDEVAYKKLKVISKAVNDGWIPDWSNSDQYKYYPWFEVLPSGLGFSDADYYYSLTITYVGSRLCFETREKAEFVGTQFIDLYEDFLLLTK